MSSKITLILDPRGPPLPHDTEPELSSLSHLQPHPPLHLVEIEVNTEVKTKMVYSGNGKKSSFAIASGTDKK